jgi:hypothetical protein
MNQLSRSEWLSLPDTERERIKARHREARRLCRYSGDRYSFLTWAFIRGMLYRRVERAHKTQVVDSKDLLACAEWGKLPWGFDMVGNDIVYTHHLPDLVTLQDRLEHLGVVVSESELQRWLLNPSGAVEQPKRVKRPYNTEWSEPIVAKAEGSSPTVFVGVDLGREMGWDDGC